MLERPISKACWTRVRFDQIATQINDRVDNPAEAGVERYVGLEHLDPDSLRIRRWGEPTDVESTKLRFQPGDIIFGKRRVYQRKVAVADFEGICSAHAMVLRAKPGAVLFEFLPFFMQSDLFMERALSISVGSLSPTINWKALAAEEFLLPPIQQQARLVETLTAVQATTDELKRLVAAGEVLIEAALADAFRKGSKPRPLADWCHNLITYGIVQAGPDIPAGTPYIRVSDMTDVEQLSLEGMLRTSPEIAHKYRRSMVRAGDLVIALRGPVGLTHIVPPCLDGANLTQGTARISVSEENSTEYVQWALRSPLVKHEYSSRAKGSTFAEISLEALRKLPIPVASIDEQHAISKRLTTISSAATSARARLLDAQRIMSRIISQVAE
ncbi:restriction endonuclease subunit S [Ensifer sp. ENS11]|uniref:restriction endonuclease subunit S n=1 Tax=Ensifer sp. ENS11 TaxID=2769291 RepID=UPI00178518E1|nr:restriction endonuclease subunit S [Ensifer sp. ENS11]MBD9488751.1 restriction endonuclease subunit S [Ensifer sp. ENS11]